MAAREHDLQPPPSEHGISENCHDENRCARATFAEAKLITGRHHWIFDRVLLGKLEERIVPVLISRLEINHFLSFGPDSPAIELGPLTVIVGPNGSGKSNLLDALTFLSALPQLGMRRAAADLNDPSSVHWREEVAVDCRLCAEIRTLGTELWRYEIAVKAANRGDRNELELVSEQLNFVGLLEIDAGKAYPQKALGYLVFRNHPPETPVRGSFLSPTGQPAREPIEKFGEKETVFVQLRDPADDHGFVRVAAALASPAIYDTWIFGRQSRLRGAQKTSQPADHTARDFSNFQLVLNRLCGKPKAKAKLLGYLDRLAPGIEDIGLDTLGGAAALYVSQHGQRVTTDRLSDGTLRTLAMLSVFCDPDPPRMIVFEEPELGLHPDMAPAVADLLRDAAERTQVVVTTHSVSLVDCFTETPEVLQVCEMSDGQTRIAPATGLGFRKILERSSLGTVWSEGHIGGNRW